MELNADFSKRALVRSTQLPWEASPAAGVERRMLDRIGDEVARATTIVRYRAGSRFEAHTHGGGEEFLVLDGVFQDEAGDYPAGSYVRNPPGSRHTPRSDGGCVIFVKLRQFDHSDQIFVRERIDMSAVDARSTLLFQRPDEAVSFERLAAGDIFERAAPMGAELLVLAGALEESGERLAALDWLRLPAPATLRLSAGPEGASFWLKLGGRRNHSQRS
jgi:quercetin dioxygenase-like cupin family protein